MFDAEASAVHGGIQARSGAAAQGTDKLAAAIARELGIPRNRLYKWAQDVEKKGNQAFAGSGRPKASGDELAVLKRENARLKEENKILKQAAAYFARELS